MREMFPVGSGQYSSVHCGVCVLRKFHNSIRSNLPIICSSFNVGLIDDDLFSSFDGYGRKIAER